TYKPGTDTLRRSAAVELCKSLVECGARVHAHDPAVQELPPGLAAGIILHASALEAVMGSHMLVVATEWPDYLQINANAVVAAMKSPFVVDATRFLAKTLGADARIGYASVGRKATRGTR
ncbi:MAG: UDP-glucose/GDP-mannose dehydrogenase family protein, partial [bacterium]